MRQRDPEGVRRRGSECWPFATLRVPCATRAAVRLRGAPAHGPERAVPIKLVRSETGMGVSSYRMDAVLVEPYVPQAR